MRMLCAHFRGGRPSLWIIDNGDVCGIPGTSQIALDPARAAVSALDNGGSTSKHTLFNNVQVVPVGSVAYLSVKHVI